MGRKGRDASLGQEKGALFILAFTGPRLEKLIRPPLPCLHCVSPVPSPSPHPSRCYTLSQHEISESIEMCLLAGPPPSKRAITEGAGGACPVSYLPKNHRRGEGGGGRGFTRRAGEGRKGRAG